MISTVLFALLSMVIAVLTGFFAVSLIDRELELRFRILFSIPLGFGIHSLMYFIYQNLNIYDFGKYKIFEYIVVTILAICYYNQDRPDLTKHKFRSLNKWFCVFNVYAVSVFMEYFLINPMGHWDGFRLWNMKAQFLIVQSPEWHNMFRLSDFLSHCDYPLFVPSATARMWMYLGGENYFTNVVLGAVFTFTVIYLLYQAISYFKNERVALVVSCMLMVFDIFMYNGAGQCADVPLALFFLSAVVTLFLYFKTKRFSTLVLSMIFAGLSVWVKNEGLMFLAIFSVVLGLYFLCKKNWKQLAALIGTVVPFVLYSVWYKSFTTIPNDLIIGIAKYNSYKFLLEPYRYLVLFKSFVGLLIKPYSIFLALSILCLKGMKVKEKIKVPFLLSVAILVLMVLGYSFIYIASPHDINWIVEYSLFRILLQILPVFLLIFSFSLRIGKPDTLN